LRAAADERARVAELDRVRAEGERANAEAEAREQRKRRRVQLALATALGLLLIGAGAFAWHSDRQTTQRRARLGQNAEAVAALLDQCKDALEADRADRAAFTLEAAEQRAADGGAEDLTGRLAQYRADLRLLRELDDIDTFRRTWVGRSFPEHETVATRWRAALAKYGVTPDEARAAESAQRVNESLVRERLLAALDGWLGLGPSAERAGVRAVLRVADPDTYRDAVRSALAAADARSVVALGRQPEALAQPAGFAATLGQLVEVPAERRRAVLESALRARTGDLGLLMGLAQTYPVNQSEGASERLRWYQAAVAAHPENVAARNNLGATLRERGDLDGAISHFKDAIRFDPAFDRAHFNLGVALRDKQDLDGAIAAFREANRLAPWFAHGHFSLGQALQAQGHLDEAIASFKEAARLDPNFAGTHYSLGIALRDRGKLDEAIVAYRDAIRLEPTHARAHNNLGTALRDNRDPDGAIVCFKEAIRLDPNLAPAHTNLGVSLSAKRDLGGAIACFKEAVRVDPKFVGAHFNLGLNLQNSGDPDGAITSFREAIRLDPNHAPAHYNLGVLLQKADPDEAVVAYRETIRLDPNHARGHNNLAVLLQAKGDLGGAVAAYREAIRLDSKLAPAHSNLAWLLAAGPDGILDGGQAVVHAAQACDLTGWKEPRFIAILGAAHAEAGDFDKAAEFQKEALSFLDYKKRFGTAGEARLQLYALKKPYRDPVYARREIAPPPRMVVW
jgi:tetratricopeptide (TPR) repeat protein